MTTREELIDAGARNVPVSADLVAQILDAVEPLIRADEQARFARWKAEATEVMREWERVWEALGSPGRLGESKAAAALALITAQERP